MMKTGHRIVATFCVTNMWCASQVLIPKDGDGLATVFAGDALTVGLAALLGLAMSTWNDYDHNMYKDRSNPIIGMVRKTAMLGYTLHTAKDQAEWERRSRRYASTWEPGDLHRGPTHCIEWCLMVGLLIGVVAELLFGAFGIAAWWLGVGAFVGTASHVCADALTPAGVPFSALYNWARYGEVWKRHALGWKIPYVHIVWSVQVGPVRVEIPYLTWIRYPKVVAVSDRSPGCRPGIFRTDRAGEHLFTIYCAVPATVACVLAWIGALNPIMHALTWGAWPS